MSLAFTPRTEAATPVAPLLFEQILNSGADYTKLVNSFSIERKLEEIRRKRLPLTLHVYKDGKDYVYQSSIQAIDAGGNQAILTQLMPSSWRNLIQQKLQVTVSCHMPNGHLLFDSKVFPFENSLYCVLEIPSEMHKQQLRSSYRVSTEEQDTQLSLWVNNRKFSGKCMDLSLSGCRGQFSDELQVFLNAITDDNDEPALQHGRFVLQVEIQDSLRFQTVARVCRSSKDEGGKLTLGINFINPDSDGQRTLQRSLTAIQREQQRRSPAVA